ncbi:putative porin [Chitinophaga niabensis]|uniref:putative porin n=1 Tax=Chitinophaga niabensis TaxID=536979 RepID=UPI0031B9B92E
MRQFTIILLLLVCSGTALRAQINTGRIPTGAGGGNSRMQRDTTKHDHEPDTLTLRFRYLDEPTDFMLDSSITDFNLNYLNVPANYTTLGNNGSAARNQIFSPRMVPGFDPGFHAFDVYGFNHQNARFYNTNRPYSELGYLIGSKQEQMINLMHTQNRGEKFNFSFAYRKINSQGYYRNQSTNHDNYKVTANYNSQNKRYHILMSYYLNKINGGENGGITNIAELKDPENTQLRLIPTNLGGSNPASSTIFNTNIPVKNAYQEASFLFRHQYDWGKGDTIHVNDTTDVYKFDPVFRVEHTFTYTQNTYEYIDRNVDTTFYKKNYGFVFPPPATTGFTDTILTRHQWRILSNDLSFIQFPIRGNMAHFIKIGGGFDNIIGEFIDNTGITFQNLRIHGEYRNKTKNQKWDLSAKGEFYLLGENAGDYSVSASLRRYLNSTLGNITLMGLNVNREPSYVYRYFATDPEHNKVYRNPNIQKENTTLLQVRSDNPKLKYSIVGSYYLFNKYTYFKSYSESEQFTGLFNLLQIVGQKRFDVRSFSFLADLAFQQLAGNAPIQLPTFWGRVRAGYNARLFKNLNLFTGIEGKYNTPYYTDDYSPMFGQFVYQTAIKREVYPDLAGFVHFRIKSFTAYVRAENLNTFLWDQNFFAPQYPSNDFSLRVGLRWWFIN